MANTWIRTRNACILSDELVALYINEDCDIIAVLKNSGQVLVDRFVDVNEATEQLNQITSTILAHELAKKKEREKTFKGFEDGLSFNFGNGGE